MRRLPLSVLAVAIATVVSLVLSASGAQAVVVDMGASGQSGIALLPGATLPATIQRATSAPSCIDPWLPGNLGGPTLPSDALCWQGGTVMHGNEAFALTWDPLRRDWQSTRNYLEQYQRDVADASGSFTSPYALTTQYKDGGLPGDRAGNASLYGGGCIDYGASGGASCQFGNAVGSAAGNDYPSSGCPVTGASYPSLTNDTCLTDAQIQSQLGTTVAQMHLADHLQPGYTPLLVMLTPPGVEVCLDSTNSACSANSDAKSVAAQFCSYHSTLQVGSTRFAYVVQPWTAYTACDDPNIPAIGPTPTAQELATDVGSRLVSPLSQSELAAITDPWMNGWFAKDASEIDDGADDSHRCVAVKPGDKATIGHSGQNPYFIKSAFNNAGTLEFDPNSPACGLGVALAPAFVVPSPIDQGDVVAFDGSETVSTLMIPQSGYRWNFGDGDQQTGPSVVHAYARGGSYTVTLTVTDRGGNVRTISQTIQVLGPTGQPAGPSRTPSSPGLHARLQILPQGLRSMLRSGIAVRVVSNQRADAFATLSIPRAAARRAHLNVGRGASVVIARGTVSGISAGTRLLHVRLSRSMATKLARLGHVNVTLRLTLVAADRNHLTIDAAGRY